MSRAFGKVTRSVIHHSANFLRQDKVPTVRHYLVVMQIVDKESTIVGRINLISHMLYLT